MDFKHFGYTLHNDAINQKLDSNVNKTHTHEKQLIITYNFMKLNCNYFYGGWWWSLSVLL